MSDRKRFGIVLSTKFHSSSKASLKESEWQDLCQKCLGQIQWTGIYTNWSNSNHWVKSSSSSGSTLADALPTFGNDCEKYATDLHLLMDHLPKYGPNEFLLDIVWITDGLPAVKKLPISLFGALKRAVDWHGAAVTVIVPKSEDLDKDFCYLKELKAERISLSAALESLSEFVDPSIFWRGSIAFFNEEDMSFENLDGFELVSTDKSCPQIPGLISQRLKVLHTCTISSIPPFYVTGQKFWLRKSLTSDDDDLAEEFLESKDYFGDTNCVIVKLENLSKSNSSSTFMEAKNKNRRTTEAWKKFVVAAADSDHIDQDGPLANKSLDSTYFVICDDSQNGSTNFEERNCLEKLCIILDPSVVTGGLAKSFDVVHDIIGREGNGAADGETEPDLDIRLKQLNVKCEFSQLMGVLSSLEEKFVNYLNEKHPESPYLNPEKLPHVLNHVKAKLIQEWFNNYDGDEVAIQDRRKNPAFASMPLNGYEPVQDITESEERRFLAFVQHWKNKKEEKRRQLQGDGTMQARENFVVLEAKEILKLFTPNGSPMKKEDRVEIRGNRVLKTPANVDELKNADNWPDLLLVDYHDLYYNRYIASPISRVFLFN